VRMRDWPNAVVRFAPAVVILMMISAAAHFVSAQTPAQTQAQTQTQTQGAQPSAPRQATDAQRPRAGGREAEADLSITARVTADSLRFEKVPNARVEFTGRPERETVWESERVNLPEQAQPGVTYRDIGITLRITSVFADIDRIVAEALGEVPLREESQPPAARPSDAPPERPAASTAPPQVSKAPPANDAADRRRRPTRRGRTN